MQQVPTTRLRTHPAAVGPRCAYSRSNFGRPLNSGSHDEYWVGIRIVGARAALTNDICMTAECRTEKQKGSFEWRAIYTRQPVLS